MTKWYAINYYVADAALL